MFTNRFVDRDMFMRYRGGGIGHTYMRAIEQIYENMSRERNHYKTEKRKGTRPNKDIPISDADGVDDDDGTEDETPTTATNTSGVETLAGEALDDDDSDDNGEYFPDSDSRSSSGVSDSDDLDSDGNCGDYESYGLGDL